MVRLLEFFQVSKLGFSPRFAIRDYLCHLDPEKDYEEICFLSACYEFPFDTHRALEYALLRTFGVPKSSKLLIHTGEFNQRPQKRYDDTVLILTEILEGGLDSERGQAAIARMNKIHRHYSISNEEFLYVLTTFVFEPIRWNERFGWRPLLPEERLAAFYYWRELGQRMHITNIPETYSELEQFNLAYEKAHFHYSEANQQLGIAVRDLFLSWFPALLQPLLKHVIYAMLDERMLDAFGFPYPSFVMRRIVQFTLKTRGRLLRQLPSRRHPYLISQKKNRTYPNGYEVNDLGPSHFNLN